MGHHPNYLYRMTTIFAITTMAPSLSVAVITSPSPPSSSSTEGDSTSSSVLGTVLSLSSDPIPNIRFNVCKAFGVLSAVLSSDPAGRSVVSEQILPALERLKADGDADVRFFAGQAGEVAGRAEKGKVELPISEAQLEGRGTNAAEEVGKGGAKPLGSA